MGRNKRWKQWNLNGLHEEVVAPHPIEFSQLPPPTTPLQDMKILARDRSVSCLLNDSVQHLGFLWVLHMVGKVLLIPCDGRNELQNMQTSLQQLVDSPESLLAWNMTLTVTHAFFNFGESISNQLFDLLLYLANLSYCPLGCGLVHQCHYLSSYTSW